MVNIDPNSVDLRIFRLLRDPTVENSPWFARIPVIEFDFSTFIRADGDSMSRCVFFSFFVFPKKVWWWFRVSRSGWSYNPRKHLSQKNIMKSQWSSESDEYLPGTSTPPKQTWFTTTWSCSTPIMFFLYLRNIEHVVSTLHKHMFLLGTLKNSGFMQRNELWAVGEKAWNPDLLFLCFHRKASEMICGELWTWWFFTPKTPTNDCTWFPFLKIILRLC